MGLLTNLFWFAFIVLTLLLPVYRQRGIEGRRLALLRRLEGRRGSRVITLIHRQEALAILGFPVARYINIEDSEQILRAIRLTPDEMPIDLILHTPGGLVLAAEQIAMAIRRRRGKVSVFVPHYAMSGGTLVALAGDEIVMDGNAVLGPVDPQIGNYPAASLLRVLQEKPRQEIEDETLIFADVAQKAIYQVQATVHEILKEKMDDERAREVTRILTEGRWTHDYPITMEQLKALGLNAREGLPMEVYELMELYPQPPQRRPSVQYVPLPYQRPGRRSK